MKKWTLEDFGRPVPKSMALGLCAPVYLEEMACAENV